MTPAVEDHKCHDSAKEEGKTELTVVTVCQKTPPFNSAKNQPILIIFGVQNPE